MDRWFGKVAVVTGASAGIGAGIAEALVKGGLLVVGLARRLDKLEELAETLSGNKGRLFVRRCDIRKEKDILEAFEWIKSEFGGVDILVNNAGIWSSKKIIEDDTDGYREMLDTNVLATALFTREAVASMRNRNVAGHIVNINSVDGHWVPHNDTASLYAPTKYAVTAMTEMVRKELINAGTRIKITSVSPGYVKTDIMRASGIPDHEKYFDNIPHLEPKDIADAVLYVLGTPENVQITELQIRPVGEIC